MRTTRSWIAAPMLAAVILLAPPVAGQESAETRPSAIQARQAFARLSELAGTWVGPSSDAVTGARLFDAARFEYRLTGAGTALTELANVGTSAEMLSVFFVNDDRLTLHHYCAAGNQPFLELTRATPTELVFELAGGRNLEPARDGHIHSVRFVFGPGPVEGFWSWYEDGREDHVTRRILTRRLETPQS